ncbi:MAG: DUF6494 family protein [Deltaproteobacteria bacterium]
MNEEAFNQSLRQLLKRFGVTAQREVEKQVDIGIRGGALAGRRTLPARITLEVTGGGAPIVVEGEIALD